MRKIEKLYWRWLAADRLWMREIVKRFGADAAGTIRYLPAGRGAGDLTPTKLQRYAAYFTECREAYLAESQAMRAAKPSLGG